MRYRYQDQNHKDAEGEITFLSRILLWKNKHITYFLITAIMSRQSMWNLPLDLAPTPKTLEEAERIDVLPYIRVFDKSLLE